VFEIQVNRLSLQKMERALFDTLVEGMEQTLKSVRCPEHGQTPTVVLKGHSLQVSGGCQQAIDVVSR
jgi:hypothetical protein